MSAFSGFSVARDQGGVWFREGTGTPEEDRNTIYTFLVAREQHNANLPSKCSIVSIQRSASKT
jgi:hypothetical protein